MQFFISAHLCVYFQAYLSTLTAVKLRTDDVADSISTNPATLQRASPPAQTAASLAAISNGTQTSRKSRSATARLMRNDDVTLEPPRTPTNECMLVITARQIGNEFCLINANDHPDFTDLS